MTCPDTLERPLRILCVEDDEDIRTIVQFSLSTLGGYQVLSVADGPSAVAQAEAFGPDLVLLDVMMPRMSGPETLAALRENPALSAVPMVFMTAKAMPDEVEQLLQYGATGIIVKPFDPVRLPNDLKLYMHAGRDWQAPSDG